MRLITVMGLVIENMGQRWCQWLVSKMITGAYVRVIKRTGDIGITQASDNAFDAGVLGIPSSSKVLEIFKQQSAQIGRHISSALNPLKPNAVTHEDMIQRSVE